MREVVSVWRTKRSRNWGRLTEEERKDEVVSDQDIVELTLAHINIHGPYDGAHSLGSRRPREIISGRPSRDEEANRSRPAPRRGVLASAAGNNLCLVLAITVELREIQADTFCRSYGSRLPTCCQQAR